MCVCLNAFLSVIVLGPELFMLVACVCVCVCMCVCVCVCVWHKTHVITLCVCVCALGLRVFLATTPVRGSGPLPRVQLDKHRHRWLSRISSGRGFSCSPPPDQSSADLRSHDPRRGSWDTVGWVMALAPAGLLIWKECICTSLSAQDWSNYTELH